MPIDRVRAQVGVFERCSALLLSSGRSATGR